MENEDNKSKLKHFVAGAALVVVLGTAIPAGGNYFAQVIGGNPPPGDQTGSQVTSPPGGNFQEGGFQGNGFQEGSFKPGNFQEGAFKGNGFQEGGFKPGNFQESGFKPGNFQEGGFKGSNPKSVNKFPADNSSGNESSGSFLKGGFSQFSTGGIKNSNDNFANYKPNSNKSEFQENSWPSNDKKFTPPSDKPLSRNKKIEIEELDIEAVDVDYTKDLEKLVKNAEKASKLKSFKTFLEKVYTYASQAQEIYQEAELEGCEENSDALTEWLSLNDSGQKLSTKDKSALKKSFKTYVSCVKQAYKDATAETEE